MGALHWLMRFWPRGAACLYLWLFLFFFAVGAALMMLGFDLGEVDRGLDAQGGWLDAVGSLLFRAVCGVVLLICVLTVAGAVFERVRPGPGAGNGPRDLTAPDPDLAERLGGPADAEPAPEPIKPPGLGCAILALIVGYFAWFGMVYP